MGRHRANGPPPDNERVVSMPGEDSKTCTKCGGAKALSEYYVRDERPIAACKTCTKAAVIAYRERNPEKVKGWQRTGDRNYRERYPERRRAIELSWRERNHERYEAWRQAYRDSHREEISAYNEAYKTTNPEALRRKKRKRRARLANVESDDYTRREIYDRDGGRCRQCETEVSFDQFHIDHIVPITLEGPDVRSNVQVLCPTCNRKKGTRLNGQVRLPV